MVLWTGCAARVATAASAGEPVARVEARAPGPVADEPGLAVPLQVAGPAIAGEGRLCSSDPRVTGCASHRPKGTPHLLGMAARGGTIALAWVFAGNPWLSSSGREGVRASRVGIALVDGELRERRALELALPDAATEVDVAATPDGWVVAAQTGQGVQLVWLDARGEPTGRRVELARASYPGLVATATGELLVVHLGEREGRWPVFATLVDREGRTAWSVPVFEGSVEPNIGNQVVADGGGFLIARRSNQGVTVARVERDGVVSVHAPISATTEYPSLAWCGGEGRLVWSEFSGTGRIVAARLDRMGRRAGSEVVLGKIPEAFNHSPALCEGGSWWVLRGGYTGGTGVSNRLDLMRVDAERGAEAGASPILASPGPNVYDPRLVRLDDDRVAVAWIALEGESRARIGMATVAAPAVPAGDATIAR